MGKKRASWLSPLQFGAESPVNEYGVVRDFLTVTLGIAGRSEGHFVIWSLLFATWSNDFAERERNLPRCSSDKLKNDGGPLRTIYITGGRSAFYRCNSGHMIRPTELVPLFHRSEEEGVNPEQNRWLAGGMPEHIWSSAGKEWKRLVRTVSGSTLFQFGQNEIQT